MIMNISVLAKGYLRLAYFMGVKNFHPNRMINKVFYSAKYNVWRTLFYGY